MLGTRAMEPELTQAVRIVLKYEIQSLLSRLSDTGEEYIVLTASTDDKTCGHIGSAKGEGFVQSSDLQSVKQDFLEFCTGSSKSQSPVELASSAAITTVEASHVVTNNLPSSRPHRRKSTPRCKIRQPVVPEAAHSSMSTPVDSPQFNSESAFVTGSMATEELSKALDLSEKSGGYSYTLEQRPECSNYSNGLVGGTMAGFVYEDAAIKADYEPEYPTVEPKAFKNEWMEEKIDLSSNPIVKSELEEKKPKVEFATDDIAVPLSSDISKQLAAVAGFSASGLGISKPSAWRSASRRKSRRAPVKVERKLSLGTLGLSANADSTIAMNADDNTVPSDVPEFSSKVFVSKKPGNSLVNISPNIKMQRGRKGIDISDMKSAFEEIGNMAKCLICNKILANKNNRTFHWRSHVGDKRYSCDICHKAFTHPSNMRSHRKIHTDEKPFPCDLCDRRFRRRDYLLQHLERFHYNPKSQQNSDAGPENSTSAQGSESNSN